MTVSQEAAWTAHPELLQHVHTKEEGVAEHVYTAAGATHCSIWLFHIVDFARAHEPLAGQCRGPGIQTARQVRQRFGKHDLQKAP
jgi:hypothetical protein